MSLDFLINDSVEEQAKLLELGDKWVELTEGKVCGEVIDRDEYLRRIQKLPLYDAVKDDLDFYVDKLDKSNSPHSPERSVNLKLLKYGLDLNLLIDGFLENPEYQNRQCKACSPLSLEQIVGNKRLTSDKKVVSKQDQIKDSMNFSTFVSTLKDFDFAEPKIIMSLGLRKKWSVYKKSIGLFKEYSEGAKNLKLFLNNFLKNPSYQCEAKHFGESYDLKQLCSLKLLEKNGDIVSLRQKTKDSTSFQGLYITLTRDPSLKDVLLDACGLKSQWYEYENSFGLPENYNENNRNLKFFLNTFLENPDYKSNKEDFGNSFSLKYLFQNKTINSDGLIITSNSGKRYSALSEMLRRDYSMKEKILRTCNLEKEWHKYETSVGLPEKFNEKNLNLKLFLKTFLKNPDYQKAQGDLGKAYSLNQLFKNKRFSKYCSVVGRSSCVESVSYDSLSSRVKNNESLKCKILKICGIEKEWQAYQQSTADNPYKM